MPEKLTRLPTATRRTAASSTDPHRGVDGRRTKQARKAAVLTALRGGATRRGASGIAGISPDTFYDWVHKDPAFSDAVLVAESEAEGVMALRVQQAAAQGDTKAAMWWLERRGGPEWRGEAPIVQVGVAVANTPAFAPSEDFAATVVRILQRAGQLPEEADPDDLAPRLVAPAEPLPPAGPQDGRAVDA